MSDTESKLKLTRKERLDVGGDNTWFPNTEAIADEATRKAVRWCFQVVSDYHYLTWGEFKVKYPSVGDKYFSVDGMLEFLAHAEGLVINLNEQ